MDQQRVRVRTDLAGPGSGPVLYWMHREFRVRDNWGLIHAQRLALQRQVPLAVFFCLSPSFLEATLRQYAFLLAGIEEVAEALRHVNIPLVLRIGEPGQEMVHLCRQRNPAVLVTDFDPLRIKRQWLATVLQAGQVPVHEVDSRNIVPCWIASDHREVGARTLRPKIHRQLQRFLTPFPELKPHPHTWPTALSGPDCTVLRSALRADASVPPVQWLRPGPSAAAGTLATFLAKRLPHYDRRNDPNAQVCSDLSPYLHFGMIAAQRIALAVGNTGRWTAQSDAFLEELIVRRELADNFCLYTPEYDQVSAFPQWAQATLRRHQGDRRPYLYQPEDFDRAVTHDPLWNAAQRQLVVTGKMHGYMRMYWAKKILEWTEDPDQALRIAIWLNDRYALDGRDTNGYAGIAWSLGGVHDRGWTERPVFGTIRYMNDKGAARKFDVKTYCQTWAPRQGELFARGERPAS